MSVKEAKTRAAKIYNKTKKPGEAKLTTRHKQSTGDILADAYRKDR